MSRDQDPGVGQQLCELRVCDSLSSAILEEQTPLMLVDIQRDPSKPVSLEAKQ